MKKNTSALLSTLILLGSPLGAQTLLTPVAATASSTNGTMRGPENTINLPDLALADTHPWGENGVAWQSTGEVDGATISFDLGGLVDLTQGHVWNYGQGAPYGGRSIRNIDVYVSSTDTSDESLAVFTLAVDDVRITQPSSDPTSVRSFSLVSNDVRWVRFVVDGGPGVGNYGDPDRVGLFEVKFTAVEAPATGSGLEIRDITEVGEDLYELEILGSPDTAYELVSSPDLIFATGQAVQNITQGDVSDPGTISGVNSEIFTTDASGAAVIQVTLTYSPKGFVRGVESN